MAIYYFNEFDQYWADTDADKTGLEATFGNGAQVWVLDANRLYKVIGGSYVEQVTAGLTNTTQTIAGAKTFSSSIALGANSITMTGSLGATGARLTKGWFTDLEITNMPTVGGTSLSSIFGTVTSVSFTGGLISVATATTTPAFTVAGTSGGIPYFSSTSTWASSGALTASAIVLGGGAGASPTSLALGTANQILGMNNGATAHEYKTVSVANTGTTFSTTNGVGTLRVNIPTVTGTNAGVLSTGADTIAGTKSFTSATSFAAGTVSLPGIYLSTDTTTGIYRPAVGQLNIGVSGAVVANFGTSGLTITGTLKSSGAMSPVSNDGASLGTTALQYSDLFLAEGAVINWDNGDATLTQVGDVVTLAGADLKITTPGTAATSVATIDGTQTLTNKSIVGTQLTGTAHTFAANNTSGTAAYTLQAYENHPTATYSGTLTWTGTPPTTITSQEYAWSRIGDTVNLFIIVVYTNAGTSNTQLNFSLPSNCPTPATMGGSGGNANDVLPYHGGGRIEATQTGNPGNARSFIKKNAANNGYDVVVISASASAKVGSATISYRVS